MAIQEKSPVPRIFLELLNQIYEIEKKNEGPTANPSIQRNINKLKSIFETEIGPELFARSAGFTFHSPIGEKYDFTRTDCEASIAGTSTENLIITEVIKPIIRFREGGSVIIIQKAVVVATANESTNK